MKDKWFLIPNGSGFRILVRHGGVLYHLDCRSKRVIMKRETNQYLLDETGIWWKNWAIPMKGFIKKLKEALELSSDPFAWKHSNTNYNKFDYIRIGTHMSLAKLKEDK